MHLKDFELGKIKIDEFGRSSGILFVNKPKDVLSHDVVWFFRKKFQVKAVGHAGALDPFADGLLIILVGRATKLSDQLLGLDKEYEADVLFGMSTDSGDTEGRIIKKEEGRKELITNPISDDQLKEVLESFKPGYRQFVPVYSSVKVNGDKLRVLARKFDHFSIETKADGEIKKTIKFFDKDNVLKKQVEMPVKNVKINEITVVSNQSVAGKYPEDLPVFTIKVNCSKGTYIRQLAIDIGEKYGEMFSENHEAMPSMLVGLKRTKIGEWNLEDKKVFQFNEAEIRDLQERAMKFQKPKT